MKVLRIQDKLMTSDIVKKLNSNEVQLLDDYLKDLEAKSKVKDYITVSTQTATADAPYGANNWIPFSGVLSRYGTKLIPDNGTIRIGEGVSKVEVSGQIFASKGSNSGTNYQWIVIKLNDSDIACSISPNTGWFCSLWFAPRVIDVKEGDVIRVWAFDSGSVRGGANTYLNVQVVE